MTSVVSVVREVFLRIFVIFSQYKKRANIWGARRNRDIGGYMRSGTDKFGRHGRAYVHAASTNIAHRLQHLKNVHP